MAEEEFQESDVVFDETEDGGDHRDGRSFPSAKRRKLKAANGRSSVPVSIPVNASRNKWFRELDDGDGGEMVPPHLIIGRRVAGKMLAFSICTGNGRILKGRGLSEYRNSILRMTGFLEA